MDQQSGIDPAGIGHRRQQRRIGPDGEAGRDAAYRTGPIAAPPQDGAEQCRGELGDGGERHQPDGGQRISGADHPVEAIGQRQDTDHGGTPDQQQHPGGIIAPRGIAGAQLHQERNDDIVAKHGAERHRRDDDHPGPGG